MARQSINLQDTFLNQARKENVSLAIIMLDGTRITCQVKGFDNFTVIVSTDNGAEHLLYKHAIAQLVCTQPLVTAKPMFNRENAGGPPQREGGPREGGPREGGPREGGPRGDGAPRGDQRGPRPERTGVDRPGSDRGPRPQIAPRPEVIAAVKGTESGDEAPAKAEPKPGPGEKGFNKLDLSSIKLPD